MQARLPAWSRRCGGMLELTHATSGRRQSPTRSANTSERQHHQQRGEHLASRPGSACGRGPWSSSASTSSVTFIVPISAAKAAPERPAAMIAVISGPSSRSDRQADAGWRRRCRRRTGCSWTAAWKAVIRPIRKLISGTIGTASMPACSATRARRASASPAGGAPRRQALRLPRQEMRRARTGRRRGGPPRVPRARERRPRRRRRGARQGFRVELVEELPEPVGKAADLDFRPGGARLAQQVDQQRDTGAVAVFDAAAVDDHLRAGIGGWSPRRAPAPRAVRPCTRRAAPTARSSRGRLRRAGARVPPLKLPFVRTAAIMSCAAHAPGKLSLARPGGEAQRRRTGARRAAPRRCTAPRWRGARGRTWPRRRRRDPSPRGARSALTRG